MPSKSSWNPIAFVPAQVTLISFAVYAALFASLLWVHHVVPPAPTNATPAEGVNLTTAWLDLEHITDGFHPYNSRRNGEIRKWLVQRVENIVKENGFSKKSEDVVVWDGGCENVTYANKWLASSPMVRYTENENVVVYIRGEEDQQGAWWENLTDAYEGQGGVLVNAHYDSVSTGYGATDDGVGVATVLQLISHYTTKGNQPKRGIIALLNNGEEDGLYGAQVYTKHVTAKFPRMFLNLEGAGAGGRAMLFRSSDAEVTRFYANSPYPFGTVVSGDGFKRGLVRSGTDFSVFEEELGLRGLDVAFMAPRARYHTNQDDARDTSPDSLWHMLSAALDTTKAMTSYSGSEFSGSSDDGLQRANAGKASNGVWFDVFGRAFAVLKLHDLFALSVTLLVAAPVLLIILEIIIIKLDRWYPFTRKQYLHNSDDDEPVYFNGFRGFFRFPIVFSVASACVVALAFLMAKINPYILYSSEYAVWVMLLAAWFSIAWFLSTMADKVRPTALSRMYTILWIYVISWIALVFATVGENNFKLASGYFIVVYNASVFVALLISYLELLALPKRKKYVEHVANAGSPNSTRPASVSSRRLLDEQEERPRSSEADHEEANERTGLLRGGERRAQNTFARFGGRRNQDVNGPLENDDPFLAKAYGDEQAWSGALPQWTWILQFLVLAPINIILVGQIALFITSALHQTPADGNAVLPIYLMMAALTVLLMLPLAPFLHRFTFHLPTFFFFIFVGCLIYNLLAFPFSREARLKHYFIQNVDLNTGNNIVSLTGVEGFVQNIVDELPSVAGQALNCSEPDDPRRAGLQTCRWAGIAPNVVPDSQKAYTWHNHSSNHYQDWVTYNISSSDEGAAITFRGRETKNCRLLFDTPVSTVYVANTTSDIAHSNSKPTRDDDKNRGGVTELRLFSRTWEKEFQVNVTWADGKAKGKSGKVGCMWSDANKPGVIAALDEIWRFEPVWSVVSKGSDGLVEGWRDWKV